MNLTIDQLRIIEKALESALFVQIKEFEHGKDSAELHLRRQAVSAAKQAKQVGRVLESVREFLSD